MNTTAPLESNSSFIAHIVGLNIALLSSAIVPLLVKAIRVLEECLSRRMRRVVDQTDSYLMSFEKLFGLQAKAELAAILLDMDSINQR